MSSPFQVTPVAHPMLLGGRLGLCPVPGRHAGSLEADLRLLRQGIRVDVLVCLLGSQEFTSLGLAVLPERVSAHGLRWLQSPIRVGEGPAGQLEQLAATLLDLLHQGQSVVVHDKTGHGRSGTVVAAVLVAAGLPVERAIEVVRAAVPGAVESGKQTSAVVEVALSLRQKKPGSPASFPVPVALLPGATTREALFCPVSSSEMLTRMSDTHLLRSFFVRPGGGTRDEFADRSYGASVATGVGHWLLGPEGAMAWYTGDFVPLRLPGGETLPVQNPCWWTSTPRSVAYLTSDGRKLVVLDRPQDSFRTIEELVDALARPPLEPMVLAEVGAHVGHPVRLVAAGGGDYLAVGGGGSGLVAYSLAERRAFAIEGELPGGHPEWVAGHPHLPLVALCSRRLEIFDLVRRQRVFSVADTIKLGGEFSPDGRVFVFVSTMGLLALQVETWVLRCLLPPSELGRLAEDQPVRFSPNGQFLLIPSRGGVAVYPASLAGP